ncbi:MAG: TIM barrel protein [Acidobacteria bacterium]|nr:TIM barrel protein [Acidobacteriota bacterium]
MPSTRRDFVRRAGWSALAATGLSSTITTIGCRAEQAPAEAEAVVAAAPWFRISLAEWSLHRALNNGELTNLDFITEARQTYGVEGVEYVNVFFMDRARDQDYLEEMRTRCDGEGVESVLIMCDGEGRLGDPDDGARGTAVLNHVKWLEAAAFLGCHAIRVNAASEGTWEEQSALAADGLHQLAVHGEEHGLDVLVENHGGLSSNGAWLAETIGRGDHARLGTLPDFGNFRIAEGDMYDIYQGVEELMPMARAVSAKSHDFDADGNETAKDYRRLLELVRDAGYRGWVGIEYEGTIAPEPEGIMATKRLLENVRTELAAGA